MVEPVGFRAWWDRVGDWLDEWGVVALAGSAIFVFGFAVGYLARALF